MFRRERENITMKCRVDCFYGAAVPVLLQVLATYDEIREMIRDAEPPYLVPLVGMAESQSQADTVMTLPRHLDELLEDILTLHARPCVPHPNLHSAIQSVLGHRHPPW